MHTQTHTHMHTPSHIDTIVYLTQIALVLYFCHPFVFFIPFFVKDCQYTFSFGIPLTWVIHRRLGIYSHRLVAHEHIRPAPAQTRQHLKATASMLRQMEMGSTDHLEIFV